MNMKEEVNKILAQKLGIERPSSLTLNIMAAITCMSPIIVVVWSYFSIKMVQRAFTMQKVDELKVDIRKIASDPDFVEVPEGEGD